MADHALPPAQLVVVNALERIQSVHRRDLDGAADAAGNVLLRDAHAEARRAEQPGVHPVHEQDPVLHFQRTQTLLDGLHRHAAGALEVAQRGGDRLAAAQLDQAAVQPQRAALQQAAQPVLNLLRAPFERRTERLKIGSMESLHRGRATLEVQEAAFKAKPCAAGEPRRRNLATKRWNRNDAGPGRPWCYFALTSRQTRSFALRQYNCPLASTGGAHVSFPSNTL